MNTQIIDKELLKKAILVWGHDAQVEMIHEECLELALALQKYKRDLTCPVKGMEMIIDEIADVMIVMASAELLFPVEQINERISHKMGRLSKRLNTTKSG